MVLTCEVVGNITGKRLIEVLQKALPSMKISELTGEVGAKNPSRNELYVRELDSRTSAELAAGGDSDIQRLKEELRQTRESLADLENAMLSTNQKYEALKKKFGSLKAQSSDMLWNNCVPYHPNLTLLPPVEDQTSFEETDKRIGSYTLGELFGQGQFASVRLCRKDGEKEEKALKIIKKDSVSTFSAANRIALEVEALKKLRGCSVVQICDVVHTNKNIYFVLDLGPSDLFQFINEYPKGVDESIAKKITFNLFSVVWQCHNSGVYHRDLKPENILMDEGNNWCVILCDFGLCHVNNGKAGMLRDFVGSPGFFGPEMVTEKSYWGEKVDIWSCGVVLLEMVLGHDKFYKTWMHAYEPEIVKNSEAFAKAVRSAVNRVKKLPGLSIHLIDLLGEILNMNPSKRITIKDILRHPWFNSAETETSATSYASSLYQSVDSFGDKCEITLPKIAAKDILDNMKSADNDHSGSSSSFPTLAEHSPQSVSAVLKIPMRPPSAQPSEASLDDVYGRKKFIKF